jgi:lysozyme
MTDADLQALDQQLTANEARRRYLYDDATGKRITMGSVVVGHPTIGIGFNLDAQEMPDEVMDLWFQTLRTRAINELFNGLPWTQRLSTGPLRALIDLCYNAGFRGLTGFHKMLDALQRGDVPTAQREMVNSTLPTRRARMLAALLGS